MTQFLIIKSEGRGHTSAVVVASEGNVFVDVWVEVHQRILGHAAFAFQAVVVNDVWQSTGR